MSDNVNFFVRYASAEDAQRALQVAEVPLEDRKLYVSPSLTKRELLRSITYEFPHSTIKSREKPLRRFFPREGSGHNRDTEGNERILNAIRGTSRPDSRKEQAFEPQHRGDITAQQDYWWMMSVLERGLTWEAIPIYEGCCFIVGGSRTEEVYTLNCRFVP